MIVSFPNLEKTDLKKFFLEGNGYFIFLSLGAGNKNLGEESFTKGGGGKSKNVKINFFD